MARWDADLRAMGWEVHGAAIEHITETIKNDATLAEVRERGAGIRLIMDQLGEKLLNGATINGGTN